MRNCDHKTYLVLDDDALAQAVEVGETLLDADALLVDLRADSVLN